jgi:hypothetical protein
MFFFVITEKLFKSKAAVKSVAPTAEPGSSGGTSSGAAPPAPATK